MSRARRVLFVSNEASRTGAPMLLLHFLRWFRANSEIPFDIVLRNGGELEPEFGALGPTSVLRRHPGRTFSARDITAVTRLMLARAAGGTAPALVYSNTAANGDVLKLLTGADTRVLSHIHELSTVIQLIGESFATVKRLTSRYIACSHATKASLVEAHAIEASLIDVVHEFIPVPDGERREDASKARSRLREELGIPPRSLVVGAAGTIGARKGSDLFVELARIVRERRADLPVHFVWVGGERSGGWPVERVLHEVRKAGLEGRVAFVGERVDPLDYFRGFDVFALVSREDAFPLVCLEAAAVETPILCFDGAGGAPELVEDDCGFVLPYLDVGAMAERVLQLLEDDELRRRLGRRAADKVRARHDVSVGAPRILRLIEAQLASRSA